MASVGYAMSSIHWLNGICSVFVNVLHVGVYSCQGVKQNLFDDADGDPNSMISQCCRSH